MIFLEDVRGQMSVETFNEIMEEGQLSTNHERL